MEELKIVYLPPEELTPYENNARVHSAEDIEAIKASIKESGGFYDPIGIWGPNNIIVEGHGRRDAAMELGIELVPCVRLDHLTDEERRYYCIIHNRSAELSGWDVALLEDELSSEDIMRFDLTSIGLLCPNAHTGGHQEADGCDADDPKKPKSDLCCPRCGSLHVANS